MKTSYSDPNLLFNLKCKMSKSSAYYATNYVHSISILSPFWVSDWHNRSVTVILDSAWFTLFYETTVGLNLMWSYFSFYNSKEFVK